MEIPIPADMIVEQGKGRGTVVSVRDLMVLLGASDEQLRDSDERAEILAREPWRRDTLLFIVTCKYGDGYGGHDEGDIDWRGTRFDKATRTVMVIDRERKLCTGFQEITKDPVEDALPYVPLGSSEWLYKRPKMSEDERRLAMAEWMKSRPECVQRLAAEFPFGTTLELDGARVHVIGWNEADRLIISHLEPSEENYDEAIRTRRHVCAEHFRGKAT